MSEQDETPPLKRLKLRMKFGAEMNDPPPPSPSSLLPPEEPDNADCKPEKKP